MFTSMKPITMPTGQRLLGSSTQHERVLATVLGRFPFNKNNSGLKFRKIPLAQGNSTFRLHWPYPSHCAFGYCSFKQHTKERYLGQWKARQTEMTRLLKVDHFQSWSRIFRSDQTEMVRSTWCINRNVFGNLVWMESAPGLPFSLHVWK